MVSVLVSSADLSANQVSVAMSIHPQKVIAYANALRHVISTNFKLILVGGAAANPAMAPKSPCRTIYIF